MPDSSVVADLVAIRPEVHAGVALLNDKRPRWLTKINPAILDMRECSLCMLGQLFGRYLDGSGKLHLFGIQSKFGFDLPENVLLSEPILRSYNELGEEWLAVIAALRNGTYDPAVSTYPRYGGEA